MGHGFCQKYCSHTGSPLAADSVKAYLPAAVWGPTWAARMQPALSWSSPWATGDSRVWHLKSLLPLLLH